jgi:hypothetical protein
MVSCCTFAMAATSAARNCGIFILGAIPAFYGGVAMPSKPRDLRRRLTLDLLLELLDGNGRLVAPLTVGRLLRLHLLCGPSKPMGLPSSR